MPRAAEPRAPDRRPDHRPSSRVAASWERSRRAGVAPDEWSVPYQPESRSGAVEALVRAAEPVMARLRQDLLDLPVGVVLADEQARVVAQSTGSRQLRQRLEALQLTDGFVWSEDAVGTNGIGTALRERTPSLVRGADHYADVLTDMACAGAPVTGPGGREVLGVVNLTCATDDAGVLLLAMARRAARDMRELLVAQGHGNPDAGAHDQGQRWQRLTAAEGRIAELVADGLTNRDVADRLHVSRHTVDFHLRHVFQKLHISSRVELARIVGARETTGSAVA